MTLYCQYEAKVYIVKVLIDSICFVLTITYTLIELKHITIDMHPTIRRSSFDTYALSAITLVSPKADTSPTQSISYIQLTCLCIRSSSVKRTYTH